MNWYNTGYDGINKEEQRIQSMSGPNRLWIPAGSGRDLVLVDDDAFCIYEHNAKINGSWRNHHTCNQGFEPSCESCVRLGDKSKAYTGYLTCCDCTLHTDKKGNKYQYELKLVGAKLGLLKKWRRKKDERGSIAMTKVKIHREDDKKAATGDEWEFGEVVKDPKKLFELANYRGKKLTELWDKAEENEQAMKLLKQVFQLQVNEDGSLVRTLVPFNYMEVLKPRGNAWVKDMLGGRSRDELQGKGDEGEGGAASSNEDDIPF